MFGYVRIYKPDLRISEYEHYQGIYCSLCKHLGKKYGLLSRLTLSYDFTFLALLHSALDDKCAGFKKARCLFNPFKKKACCCDNEHIDFAADVASILIYYKVKDNISDNSFFSSIPSRLLLPSAYYAKKKASKKRPDIDKIVNDCMLMQSKIEAEGTKSIDAAAEPTARILSKLAQNTCRDNCDDKEQRILERFGYCLGRWIYLIDAADDLMDDVSKGNYNPFINYLGIEYINSNKHSKDFLLSIEPMLNACLAECIAAYNLLEIKRFDGILRNILEQGMPFVQKRVIAKKGES
jgi:hypothetical protein